MCVYESVHQSIYQIHKWKNCIAVAKLEVFGDDLTEMTEYIELGEGREVVVNLTVQNTGDPAYTAAVSLNFR